MEAHAAIRPLKNDGMEERRMSSSRSAVPGQVSGQRFQPENVMLAIGTEVLSSAKNKEAESSL